MLLVMKCNLLCLEAVRNCPSWDLPQVQCHQSLVAVNGPSTTSGLLHVTENRCAQDKELTGTITADAIASEPSSHCVKIRVLRTGDQDPRTQSLEGCVVLQQLAIAKIQLYSQSLPMQQAQLTVMHTEGVSY